MGKTNTEHKSKIVPLWNRLVKMLEQGLLCPLTQDAT